MSFASSVMTPAYRGLPFHGTPDFRTEGGLEALPERITFEVPVIRFYGI